MPTNEDKINQRALVDTIKNCKENWVLGDRVDYSIVLAGKESILEASTHNVARDYPSTKVYADYVENTLVTLLQSGKIKCSVATITNFGKGKLMSYTKNKGHLIKTIKINYSDVSNLEHHVYYLKN